MIEHRCERCYTDLPSSEPYVAVRVKHIPDNTAEKWFLCEECYERIIDKELSGPPLEEDE